MPATVHRPSARTRAFGVGASLVLVLSALSTAAAAVQSADAGAHAARIRALADAEGGAHLLVSEVMTGGAGASDEFIELYNPGPFALPLEGLEVVYVSSSGLTVTRKAGWEAGAASLAAGAHLLIANEAGVFSSVADVTYANGLAAAGGSVAIRIAGAATAIDAVGWGTAASTWLEGTPVVAPPAGGSIERLPGGALGSGQDTDHNVADFVVRDVPDPQNTASPAIPVATASPTPTPSATQAASPTAPVSPTASATATVSPSPTPSSSPTPPGVLSIAEARAMPDGATVVVEGVSLSDAQFSEGGGYLADASAGIAVLVSDGTFPRGALLRVSGTVDDRFHQRTIRAEAAGIELLGQGSEPSAAQVATGDIGESLEGRLAAIQGSVAGAPSQLSAGLAIDVNDGTGLVRVVVGSATGIDTSGWVPGVVVSVRGIVGQRDSSVTGTAGYRLQPRDPQDVAIVGGPPTPTPSASPTGPGGSATPDPSQPGDPTLVSIAEARAAPIHAPVTISGVVTLPSGLSEPGSAVIQDASGGILLRLGEEAGQLQRGQQVRVAGVRSTWSGMLSVRVSEAPAQLGSQAEPAPGRRTTGGVGEAEEATLVVVRGQVVAAPRRTAAQNQYLDIDDGSGPLRVFISPRSGVSAEALVPGAWVELTGVITQETTGQQPQRGYRLWPRAAGDVRVVAPAAPGGTGEAGTGGPGPGPRNPSGSAGTPQQAGGPMPPAARPSVPAPRLALALPTATEPVVLAQAPAATPTTAHGGRAPTLLLLAAALAMLAAAWLVADPETADRLRSAAGRLLRPNDPAEDPTGAVATDGTGLVALTVLEGYGGGEGPPRGRPPAPER
ncbi:MAG TPA: lamin tail domain-containing protein [candidate division Zixibacteria bacterium]|nr:lamin tail domain-containing protein [candidate division Zixibacteria bacterium]